MDLLVALAIGVPFLGAVVCLAVRDRASKYVAVAASVITAAAGIALSANPSVSTRLLWGMPWLGEGASKGLFGWQVDPLARIMLLAASVVGALIVIYSVGYLSPGNRDHATHEGHARYFFWLLTFVGAMVGIAVSPTLLQLLIFWEITTLCSWALISFYDNEESLRAGMKALVMTSFGGLFFLGGLVWVFSKTGSMRFDALGAMSPEARGIAFACFMVAAWAKSAQLPFHTWLPDAMAAPTPISAYLHAAAMVKAGVFLVARLLTAGWELPAGASMVLSIAALATMFSALYMYFLQDDLKKLLAYSTIAQLGYILLGLGLGALGASMALRGAVLHVLMHAVAKTALFLSVGAVAYACGTRSISKLSGVVRTVPIAAVSFFVGAFALTGIPPLSCFWSKVYILSGALQIPGAFGPIALVLVLVESLTAFGWFLWVGQRVFFGRPAGDLAAPVASGHGGAGGSAYSGTTLDPPRSMEWVLVLVIVATVVAPIVGIPIVSQLAVTR